MGDKSQLPKRYDFPSGTKFVIKEFDVPLVQVPGLSLLTMTEALARYALLQLFRFPAPFGDLMTFVVLPQALYNGFIGAALVFALAWTDSIKERAS